MVVQIPYITPETLARITEAAPTLNLLIDIPLILSEEAAVGQAKKVAADRIRTAPYEYVREVASVQLDEEKQTWNVTIIISGD